MLGSLRSSLGFLTTIPVGMQSLEETARNSWSFPIAGAVVGVLAGFAGISGTLLLGREFGSLSALVVLYILTGLNHLDGLLDWADGIMVRGDREKRLKAMHDLNHGVAAFFAGFTVLFATYLAIRMSFGFLSQLVVAESSAKFAMVIACYYARNSSHAGMGDVFFREINGNRLLILKLSLAYLPFLLLSTFFAPVVLGFTVVTTAFIVRDAEKKFGGISGDVLGAINEVVRVGVLIILSSLPLHVYL